MDDKEMSLIDRLREEQLDLLIKYALLQAEQDKEVEAEIEQTVVNMAPFERALREYESQSKQRVKEERSRKRLTAMRVTARVLTCFIIILAIGMPIALASIPTFRQYVAGMMVSVQDGHLDLQLGRSDNAFIPQEWTGEYYPCYIPERYDFFSVDAYDCMAVYMDPTGDALYFLESQYDESISVDSENAETMFELIGDSMAIILIKGGYTTIAWSNEERLFVIEGTLTPDEIKLMAKSVVKVTT